MSGINGPGAPSVKTPTAYTREPVPGPGGPTGAPAGPAASPRANKKEPAHADPKKPAPVKSGTIPAPPVTTEPLKKDWTLEAIDKAAAGIDSLEKEIGTLDLNSADGNKKMLLIQRKMQRLDEMMRLISTMWTMQHDAIKATIANMR